MAVLTESEKRDDDLMNCGAVTGKDYAQQRIRVLHVISGLKVGGAETFLLRLILALSDDVDPRIVSLTSGGGMLPLLREAQVNVLELGLGGPAELMGFPSSVLRLSKEVRSWRPQIIQGWLNHGNVMALLMQRVLLRQSKVIWSIRQSFDELRLERLHTRMAIVLQSRFAAQPDAIICNSMRSREQFIELASRPTDVWVVPNGFDTSKFAPNPERRASARLLLGAKEDELVVAMVAREHAIKDYPCFIEAVGRAVRSVPRLRAVCIGRGVTSEKSGIPHLISKWNLETRCTLLEERWDLDRLYPGVDVMCLTSRAEGFPNVIGEAMACGVPCIATDVGDIASLIGDAGYTVCPGCPEEVAKLICGFAKLDREARARLGASARRRVQEMYSMSVAAKKYLRIYRDVLGQH